VTLKDDLLRAAGRARTALPHGADRAARFFRHAALATGGFPNRAGQADLYYTVFGLLGLAAMGEPPPDPTARYLDTFADGATLDLVHLCSLARCWALLEGEPGAWRQACLTPLSRLAAFRSADGGFSHVPDAACGTAYGAFLALGAYEDLGNPLPDADRLADSLAGLRARDGGYANTPGAEAGGIPATAAAMVTLAAVGRPPDARAVDWLVAHRLPESGWPAAPGLPVADLLSTATALHALAATGAHLDTGREPCRAMVDGLATENGGYRGHSADTVTDCEYSFYGLLALGHLR